MLRADRHGVLVAADSGAVLLREVQLEGRGAWERASFCRASRFCPAPASDDRAGEPRGAAAGLPEVPKMHPPPVSGGPVRSRVLLVGQAPGTKEPVLGRPFAWTAGKTLFGWFEKACGVPELEFRRSVYMAAVCRCFPGKTNAGGDRVPDAQEIVNCSEWLRAEIRLLRPALILPVGKLAIAQFMEVPRLDAIIGRAFPITAWGHACDLIPLPHPSGASPGTASRRGKSCWSRRWRWWQRTRPGGSGGGHSRRFPQSF